MIQSSEKNKEEDKKVKRRIEAMIKLDEITYALKRYFKLYGYLSSEVSSLLKFQELVRKNEKWLKYNKEASIKEHTTRKNEIITMLEDFPDVYDYCCEYVNLFDQYDTECISSSDSGDYIIFDESNSFM